MLSGWDHLYGIKLDLNQTVHPPPKSPLYPILRIADFFYSISSENPAHKATLQQEVNKHKGIRRYDLNV